MRIDSMHGKGRDDEQTKMETISQSATIKSIDTASVHRICSGQVILDLATAVKARNWAPMVTALLTGCKECY